MPWGRIKKSIADWLVPQEQEKPESEIRPSSEVARAFVESNPAALDLKSVDGRYLFVNKTWSMLTGVSAKKAQSGKGGPYYHSDHVADSARQHVEVVETGKVITRERDFDMPDGGRYTREVTKFPLYNDDGVLIAVGTIANDLTETKETKQKLERTLGEFSAVMNNIDYGILFMDSELRARLANKAFQDMWGFPDELIERSTTMAEFMQFNRYNGIYPVGDDEFDGYVAERVSKVRAGSIAPTEMVRADGKVLECQCIALPDGGRMLTYFDVTERKRTEDALSVAKEEAEIANRTKTEFLANMSHELRTPLNSIIGFAEMLKSEVFGPVGDRKYAEYATDIAASGAHLLNVIGDLLDISKIEANRLDLSEAPLDVYELIAFCVRIVGERAADKGLGLTVDSDPDLPRLIGDELRIKQILLNLMSNAIKFTPPGGQVTVRSSLQEGSFVVEVADTGIGIAPEDLPKVMAPFQQVRPDFTIAGEGTGLGVHLSLRLAELHGGSLAIDSKVGEGTKAAVRFPPDRTVQSACRSQKANQGPL